ncbi:Acyl carrier family protein [Desulfosarcina cetonica]|uniref:acyl carrier protein n=1 Tax=Desulfosarcina cetonica TaxID=90730 RepID=UPI0006D170D8|nr:phosphopantetheine-binding protein [Desulfosarcina cetonica]VTR70704.1 Acyl carrier family protein [Desulfosarcina cetonica]
MTRSEVTGKLLEIFSRQFEIDNPELDVDLREAYEFDSIDAIELLREIEILLGDPLTREEKKKAMDIRTLSQIVDYVMDLAATRPPAEA